MNQNKMGTMPINKLVLNMSIPIMISMLIQALYNIVDSMYVAQINEDALTALSLVFPIQNLMIAVAAGTAVGMNALLSRSLGERNYTKANSIAMHGIVLAIGSSLLFVVFALFFSSFYFEVQGIEGRVYEYGMDYVGVCCIFSMGIFIQITFERLLQATGRSMISMVTQATGAIINIVLDPILIFGLFGMPMMGVKGAAIATVIGQLCACLCAYYFNTKYNKEIILSLKQFKINTTYIKEIYIIGVPSIIMGSISSVMTFGMNQILLGFSHTATAFFGIYIKLQSFAYMPVFGLNNAIVPIIAFNYGAKQKQRIFAAIKVGIFYACCILVFSFGLFQLFPQFALEIFNASDEMMVIGIPALRIISFHFLFAGVSMILGSAFQALGHSFSAMVISLLRQLVVLLPVAYCFSLMGDINLVWYSYLIAEVVCLVLTIICMEYFVKKQFNSIEA